MKNNAEINDVKINELNIRITFTEEALATCPSNTELYATYIASRSPDKSTMEDEIKAVGVEGVLEQAMTVFPRNEEGEICIYDYQIKGAFKDACGMLGRVKGTKSAAIKAYKKIIDGLIFVYPRMIPISIKGYPGDCQRPLRTSGPMGDRVALAMSETVPAGSYFDCSIQYLDSAHLPLIEEWLNYFRLRGFLQWRNSGKGRATWEVAAKAKAKAA